jgi:uncharacterized protein (TIGR03437 family)
MQPVAPGFFLFNSGPYVAATHVDGSYIGPTTVYPGATTPAKPGEVVILSANGLGQTSPAILNGSQAQSGNLATLPAITVGGMVAKVQFAGVVSPGLYQLNVAIPDSVPDGDSAVIATYGGFSSQAGRLISVQH